MADDDVQVKFGAQTADLDAAIAATKAKIADLNNEAKRLATQMVATGQAGNAALVASLGAIKSEATTLNSTLNTMASGIEATGAHAINAGAGLGFYMREFRALADEIASGRYRQADGTFINLAVHGAQAAAAFATANPVLVATGAAALAAAGGFAYLVYEAVAYKDAVQEIQAQGAIDQLQLTAAAAGDVASAIAKAGDVSYANAAKFAAPFLELGPGGEKIAQIASYYLPLYTAAGEDAGKAGEKLANIFVNLKSKGAEYVASTVNMTAAQKQQFQAAQQSNNITAEYLVILQAMQGRLDGATDAIKQQKAAVDELKSAMTEAAINGTPLFDMQERLAEAAKRTAAAMNDQKNAQASLRSEASQELATSGVIAAKKSADAEKVVQSVNKESAEVNKLKGEYDLLKSQLDAIDQSKNPATSGATEIRAAMARIVDQMREAQERANGGLIPTTAFEKAQEQIKQLEATFKGLKSTLLTQELDILGLTKLGNNIPAGTKEGQQFADEIAAKRKALTEAGTEEYIKAEQVKTIAAGNGVNERLALAQKEAAAQRAANGAGSPQDLNSQVQLAQAARAAAEQRRADAAQKLDEEIADLKRATQEKLKQYADDAKEHLVSVQTASAESIKALQQESAATRALYEQKKALALTSEQDIRAINRQEQAAARDTAAQIAQEQRKAADEAQKPWNTAFQEINSAFDSQISGLLRGTTSWASAFKNVLASLTTDVIKFFVNWGLQAVENQVKQAAINAGLLASTTATVAGQTAAQATGVAAQKSMNATAVMSDAGKAAAGAYSAVAGVPIIGPILAPAAAAVAFGATEAFASFDVGSWSIPGNMLAQVHAGEMIVPASATPWAQSLMANAAANQGAGGGGGGVTHNHTWNINAIDGPSVKNLFKNNGRALVEGLNHAIGKGDHLGLRNLSPR